jgi:hypothetical protein
MANWELLDKEFYQVIDNLSEAAWQEWEQNRMQNKAMRRASMELHAKIHLERVALLNRFSDSPIFSGVKIPETNFSSIVELTLEINSNNNNPLNAGGVGFAMAA